MRRLMFHGIGQLSVEEAPMVRPAEGEVVVAVEAVGICKSDVFGFNGVNDRRQVAVDGGGGPLVMGHESVGRIAERGPDASGPVPGTPVVINPIISCGECDRCVMGLENVCRNRIVLGCQVDAPGAYSEFVRVPARNVIPFEGSVPIEWGALVEPIAVGGHGAGLGGVTSGARVMVIGGGIVGTGAALTSLRLGAEKVLVLEPIPGRRQLLAELGLEAVHPDQAPYDGSYDVVVDCVSRPGTMAQALNAAGIRGTVVMVGIHEGSIPLPVTDLVDLERRVLGSYAYRPSEYEETADWIASGAVDLGPMIQERVDFEGIIGAFDRYADGSLDAFRTIFKPV